MKKVIEVENFSKFFGNKKAVDNLSFEVFEGEIFAFLGSNGSGKTTTIRCLLNIYEQTKGMLKIFGQDYDQKLATKIGYLPEERGLYTTSRVLETLVYFASLKGMEEQTALNKAEEYLKQVDLWEARNLEIKKLSSGQQQKIQLGIAIINDPKLLILDEPTKGLDPVNRRILMDRLFELNKNGSTIIFITHQMDEVEKIADRLLMIKNGQMILYGKVDEIRNKFGDNIIHIKTNSKIPQNKKLYEIKSHKNETHLILQKNAASDEILKYLVSKNVSLNSFSRQAPSLEEIFVTVSKTHE